MTDVQGYRAVLGVIGPSTNTVVQPDMERMRPAGVTNHYRGIFVTDPVALSNEDFLAGTTAISDNTMAAVREAMTCKPDYLVLGMSAITFYGGIAGGAKFKAEVEALAGSGPRPGLNRPSPHSRPLAGSSGSASSRPTTPSPTPKCAVTSAKAGSRRSATCRWNASAGPTSPRSRRSD